MSETASTPLSLIFPGPLVGQAKAIAARLQLAFPPSKFRFKYLPGQFDKSVWERLTSGNQPFLGLGFKGFGPKQTGRVLTGAATWMLLCAVRANGGDGDRYIGDAQGVGVLTMATIAAAVLNGAPASTGTLEVAGIANVAGENWGADSAIVAVTLQVPMTINLDEAIGDPGAGIFKELAETWNVPTPDGGVDIYTSDWENPNVPA